jgi:hypothetical protein
MKPAFHTVGDRVISDSDIYRVEWNSRGMMVATSVGNRVLRGTGLLQLLPDFLSRQPLNLKVGRRIEPNAPLLRSEITDIRNAPDLPVSTQVLPDLLLDLPARFLAFQMPARLILTRWDEVLAAGWRRKGFWFALADIAYLVTPPVAIAPADQMPFLRRILDARAPNHFSASLTQAVVDRYGLQRRFPALAVEPLQLETLINDPSALSACIALSPVWQQAIARIRSAQRPSLGD